MGQIRSRDHHRPRRAGFIVVPRVESSNVLHDRPEDLAAFSLARGLKFQPQARASVRLHPQHRSVVGLRRVVKVDSRRHQWLIQQALFQLLRRHDEVLNRGREVVGERLAFVVGRKLARDPLGQRLQRRRFFDKPARAVRQVVPHRHHRVVKDRHDGIDAEEVDASLQVVANKTASARRRVNLIGQRKHATANVGLRGPDGFANRMHDTMLDAPLTALRIGVEQAHPFDLVAKPLDPNRKTQSRYEDVHHATAHRERSRVFDDVGASVPRTHEGLHRFVAVDLFAGLPRGAKPVEAVARDRSTHPGANAGDDDLWRMGLAQPGQGSQSLRDRPRVGRRIGVGRNVQLGDHEDRPIELLVGRMRRPHKERHVGCHLSRGQIIGRDVNDRRPIAGRRRQTHPPERAVCAEHAEAFSAAQGVCDALASSERRTGRCRAVHG